MSLQDSRLNLERREEQPDQLVEADPEIIQPIQDFFNEKFQWDDGEYEVSVSVTSDKITKTKCYRFTIFESESAELRAMAEHYKYGSGVFWDRDDVSQILSFELHEIDT